MLTDNSVHKEKVMKLQKNIQDVFSSDGKVKIYHGTTNSTRIQRFKKSNVLDASMFNSVVEVNKESKYVLVEPNVPMDVLLEETMKYDLVPQVVMEFPGITVGGGISGGAGESSSFKFGLFNNTCLAYELLLSDGTTVCCSPEENSDLFHGIASSYGSLAIITLAKISLVEAKPFIKLTYLKKKSVESLMSSIDNSIKTKTDYVDGIIFSKNHSVLLLGEFSELSSLPVSTFTKRTDEWFYLHALEVSSKHDTYEELIPVEDYLFRYDRGAFWTGKYINDIFWFLPFSRLTRYLFDDYFHTRKMYRALQSTELSQQYVIQDICLPRETVEQCIDYMINNLKIFPLWICPLLPTNKEFMSPTNIETKMVINIGIWGGKRYKNVAEFKEVNRAIEKEVKVLGGRKVLYAHSYYTEEEFWSIYSKKHYQKLRDMYSANKTLFSVYEKVTVRENYKPSVVLGLFRAKLSKFLPITE